MAETLNGGKLTALEPGFVERVGRKLRNTLDVWFGPDLPMSPSAPIGTPPRTLDYPVGYNINIQPRNMEPISFEQMRSLADSFDLVRLCIETRKDQVSRMPWAFRLKTPPGAPKRAANTSNSAISGDDDEEKDPRLTQLTNFFSYPDREHTWQQWVRLLLEDLLVLDAPVLVPIVSQEGELWSTGKALYALEVIDGSTIARKIDIMGRTPASPAIAYQPTTAFNITDNLGVSHFFISNSSPYTNTFVQGNGTGSVFLGSTAKAFVSDTTGALTTAGGIILQTTAQTLPANITNDTAGGILFTNNAGSSMQFGNVGTLFLNSPQGIRWTGATSGNTFVQASAVAGTGILTLPATVTDTLVARTTVDTLTNKTLTSPIITSPTINTGVSSGSGVKHQRFGASCTTGAGIGAACNSTYTWTTPFADANYSVVCTGDSRAGGALGIPVVINTNSIGPSTFFLSIAAFSATAAQFPAVDCIAFHD
jgi:hypothetical protein